MRENRPARVQIEENVSKLIKNDPQSTPKGPQIYPKMLPKACPGASQEPSWEEGTLFTLLWSPF